MSGPQANKAVVERVYAALARSDAVELLGHCDEAVEWCMCVDRDGEVQRGHEQLAELTMRMQEEGWQARFEPRRLLAEGDTVVAVGLAELRNARTGARQRSERVHVWTLRGGRVVDVKAYETERVDA